MMLIALTPAFLLQMVVQYLAQNRWTSLTTNHMAAASVNSMVEKSGVWDAGYGVSGKCGVGGKCGVSGKCVYRDSGSLNTNKARVCLKIAHS